MRIPRICVFDPLAVGMEVVLPEQAGEHEVLARVLQLATRLLREQHIGSAPLQPIADSMFTELGISRADALAVSERIHGSAGELQAIARDLAA